MRTPPPSSTLSPLLSRLRASFTPLRLTTLLLIPVGTLNASLSGALAATPPASPVIAVTARYPESSARVFVHRAGFWTSAAGTGLGVLSLLAVPRRRRAIPSLLAVLFVFSLMQHSSVGPRLFSQTAV